MAVRTSHAPTVVGATGSKITGINFVVCPSFHGATLLALLLNNHSKISDLGDTNPTRMYDQKCACEQRVSACPFWRTVSRRLDVERFADAKTLLPSMPRPLVDHHLEGAPISVSQNSQLNRLAGRSAARGADFILPALWRQSALAEYLDTWRAFYDLVSELHGTSIIVDGSKSSRKVAVMAKALSGTVPVRMIHLVRDPRGYVASARKNRQTRDIRTPSWQWADLHRRTEALGSHVPYLRVRYEDLAGRPEEVLASIFAFFDVAAEPVIAAPRFSEKHHLMGNAMLFKFDGKIETDERWRTALEPGEQAAVIRHAGAVARRYDYH